jgi:hypothetical protein
VRSTSIRNKNAFHSFICPYMFLFYSLGTGTASIRVKDINDMPPHFTKDEWFTEVDETDGTTLPDTPILTVTVHDEDETNKFHYKVCACVNLTCSKDHPVSSTQTQYDLHHVSLA